jgi:hypothetical protein
LRGVSAVIAPAAETKTLQLVPQASAGPCVRNSKCIGSVRSDPRTDAGSKKTGAAKASAVANERERLILPLTRRLTLYSCVVIHVLVGLKRRLIPPAFSQS